MSHAHSPAARPSEANREPPPMPAAGDFGGAGDALVCAGIARRHARTFSLAARLLPADKRRAANALYAFCRVADDLVDEVPDAAAVGAPHASGLDIVTRRARLQRHRDDLDAMLEGRPLGPVFRELQWTVTRFDVPVAPLHELIDGVSRDLQHAPFRDWESLEWYCQGVASSVGEMCTHVFGVAPAESLARATPFARTLGVAMQLTNILRDVGEDARRGRCYLPVDELAACGLTPADVLSGTVRPRDARWVDFMSLQVARARALYRRAEPGIAMLAADSQRCANACAVGYEGILTVIESLDYDTLSQRARLGTVARVRVLWNAWWYRAPKPRRHGSHDSPVQVIPIDGH